MRSYWPPHLETADIAPAHLEPLYLDPEDLELSLESMEMADAPPSFGFFFNADDTPRGGASVLAWPEAAAVEPHPLPRFRDSANEGRSRAA